LRCETFKKCCVMVLTWDDDEELKSLNFREQAIHIIRAQIMSGRLPAGSMHSIGAIAEKLKVSVTPVREALHDLAREGLIEMKRNRGFLVRTPSEKELDDNAQLRSILEVTAVREITTRGLIQDFGALRKLARKTEVLAAAEEWESLLAADREFHLSMLAALGNERLVELVGTLRDQTRVAGLANLAGTDAASMAAREHSQLLDAMESGDSEEAERVMTLHIEGVRSIFAGEN
jgi:DNA-binding GntR family transcriptional regulator